MHCIEDEIKVHGSHVQNGNDPCIRIPWDFTNFLGLHVADEELEKLGLIDRESEVPIVWQIHNFEQKARSNLEIIAVLDSVDPSKIFIPQTPIRTGVEDDVLYWNADNLKSIKHKGDVCSWSQLWLSLNYDQPITPQVKEHIDTNVREFQRDHFRGRNEEIKSIILHPVSAKLHYKTENGVEIDMSKLQVGRAPIEIYREAHRIMLYGCRDVMLEYEGGLLLVKRDNEPARGVLWQIGGKADKGMISEDSLRDKVREECGLDIIDKPIYLGEARTSFQTDPFGHGNGTDTTNERYFAKARGTLRLDELHETPIIIKPEDYTPEFRGGLEKYARDFMDRAFLFTEQKMDPVLLHSYLTGSLRLPN